MRFRHSRHFTPLFTKEQWKEIDEARERMIAFTDKIHPYPAYPEEIQKEHDLESRLFLANIPAPPEHRLNKKLLEVEGLVRNTRMKLQEHIAHSSKKCIKYI